VLPLWSNTNPIEVCYGWYGSCVCEQVLLMRVKTVKELTTELSALKPDDVVAVMYFDLPSMAEQAEEDYDNENFLKEDYSQEVFEEIFNNVNNDEPLWENFYEAVKDYERGVVHNVIENKALLEIEEEEAELWGEENVIHS